MEQTNKKGLDLGPDIFDWEEFDSPDDMVMVNRKREIEFLHSTAEAFVSEYQEFTFNNIQDKIDAVIQKLHDYEAEHGELEYRGYIAVKVLPTIALFMCQRIQELLPKSQQLLGDQMDGFLFQFAKLLDPHRFYDSFVSITNYADLLDYRTENQWSRVLDEKLANWLKSTATHILSELSSKAPENDETLEMRQERTKNMLHLGRIANSQYPFGFNTQYEQRWEMWDLDFLLDPEGDIREEKLVTRKSYDYLMRMARDRMDSIVSEREVPRPQMNKEQFEKEELIFQHLKKIVETGELPYGYRPVDTAMTAPNSNQGQ